MTRESHQISGRERRRRPLGRLRCPLSDVLHREILLLAGRQYGVIASAQLRSLGVATTATARARRQGLLIEIAPGVLRIASSPDTFESRCMAAALRLDGAGFLSGWTAGRLHGLRAMPATPIHLTGPARSRRDVPTWCVLHRSAWYSPDQFTTRPDGLPIATPLRALFGLAAAFNQHRFERAAEDAWHLGLLTPAAAADYLDVHRCRGKDGVLRMERWLDRALMRDRPTQSGLERLLIQELEQIGLPRPVPQHPLRLASGEVVHLDIAWPRVRLAVEPGSTWWHGGDLAQRRDQARDRACSELGWLVLRFDESMRADLPAAARQVARVYDRRLHEVSQRRMDVPEIW